MLRIHGDRGSLLAALAAHWADQQLQIPAALKPVVRRSSISSSRSTDSRSRPSGDFRLQHR